MDNFYYTIKTIIIGDSTVGKTCFLYRLVNNQFKLNTQTTVAI